LVGWSVRVSGSRTRKDPSAFLLAESAKGSFLTKPGGLAVLMVGVDPVAVEMELMAGRLGCKACGAGLAAAFTRLDPAPGLWVPRILSERSTWTFAGSSGAVKMECGDVVLVPGVRSSAAVVPAAVERSR
jgi:hypothetical protein